MAHLAILGASGHGKVAAEVAEHVGWDDISFFDDRWPDLDRNGGWRVVGDGAALGRHLGRFDGVVVAIGANRVRLEWCRELLRAGAPLVSLVHPAAAVSRRASVAAGVVVFAGAVINVDTSIGLAGIVNTGGTVDHDCVLAEGVHISPGAHLAGSVRVGECSWVGIGAAVKQGVSIGSGVMIGAGSVVIRDIADDITVAGVPASRIRQRQPC